jgi:preprotein translocase subunit SecG
VSDIAITLFILIVAAPSIGLIIAILLLRWSGRG